MSDIVFPSQAWFTEYRKRINGDDEYAEISGDWGVGFDGDFVFEMRQMPVDDIDFDALPEELAAELEEYVDRETGTGYALLGLEGGECTSAELIADVDDVEYGFKMVAEFDTWKQLVSGQIGAIDGMMSGQFELEGDMQKVLQYSDSAARLTELSSNIDATFVDEEYGA
ncbi:SCP2 sterol-binding domain-containing protein [Halorarius halobius]|uniref:SCP2 sterol-binding domain-containing protein n=1 Tax=Halorarius halobius TaxID=2962671 RepID=UPI0020CEEF92|nr:SCP2 sterol-binding domain-containing protein [Halorarius halobius]